MKFLVMSHTHSLLPFAYRLRLQEGEDTVETLVSVQAFEAAWKGKRDPAPRDDKGHLHPNHLAGVFKRAGEDNAVVVTDDWRLQGKVPEGLTCYGVHQRGHSTTEGLTSPLRVGGWFDGEHLWGHHLLIVDRGAWPGGMGPEIDGAMTMVRIDEKPARDLVDVLTEKWCEELKSSGFRGLVQWNLNFRTDSGEPEADRMEAGWPFLHTHAFVSELEDFSSLLSDPATAAIIGHRTLLPRKFVTVYPISRPPWPTRKARFRFDLAPVEGLTPQQMARVFWHDVQVDPIEQRISTAGLDGLVGIARGAGDTSELALVHALEVGLRLRLPEKQFRSDAGRRVQSALAELEGRFAVLV
jgi:hypothetical protein